MENNEKYPSIDAVATGRRIRELRISNSLRVSDLVDFLSLSSFQAVYKWQRGDNLPSIDNLFALSQLFHTPMEEILITIDDIQKDTSLL